MSKGFGQGVPAVRCRTACFALVSVVALVGGCSTVAPTAPGPRPEAWADPVVAIPGLPNLHRVTSNLYRSAQPSKEGFSSLGTSAGLVHGDRPIATVLSLRASSEDAPLVTDTSRLRLEQIRFKTWHPEDEDVVKFLRIATTPSLQPVLVHCRHGSDRTGTMIAIYRVAYQGWTKAEAKDEMIGGGFGFHPLWQNLLRYIDELDIDAIKARVAKAGPWR